MPRRNREGPSARRNEEFMDELDKKRPEKKLDNEAEEAGKKFDDRQVELMILLRNTKEMLPKVKTREVQPSELRDMLEKTEAKAEELKGMMEDENVKAYLNSLPNDKKEIRIDRISHAFKLTENLYSPFFRQEKGVQEEKE